LTGKVPGHIPGPGWLLENSTVFSDSDWSGEKYYGESAHEIFMDLLLGFTQRNLRKSLATVPSMLSIKIRPPMFSMILLHR